MKQLFSDIMKTLERKVTFLPNHDHLYDEIRHFDELQGAYNLTVIDLMDGHLLPNVTVEPALTGITH